jgi:hypothetical protein
VSRNNKIRIIYSSIIAALFLSWILFGETSISQSWHMHLARKYGVLLEKITQSKPEFHDVTYGIGTSHDGCLWVSGSVGNEKELSDLKSVIASTKPPAFVIFDVHLMPTGQKDSP